ncbi:DUF547 domain-containing protein [Arenibacter sp. TNZ]|jgi:hypothetical protein|uniref:DUF547 domain-containing protein n=1 Tax=Arenibacter TaxID=178469 RepID=UPI000CD3E408|nr:MULTISPECIES: DUF547 domain-containing protein [Arenibacter]MCM4172050.1 DUF547 domain-containing protein [Arenibacter sp. TNZ]
MRLKLSFVLTLLLTISAHSATLTPWQNKNCATEIEVQLDHSDWDKLLKKHVDNDGNVDYRGFTKDITVLRTYLDYLSNNRPSDEAPKPEKLAYYINLYNAATVKLILDNFPTKSIKDIKNPWGKNIVKIGNEDISLGDLEHKILRKMDEPLIHFAINCASYSCPKLLNKAFNAVNLEKLLEQTAIDFINDPKRNLLTTEKASLSEIFNWYKKDFTEKGSLIEYINKYAIKKLTSNTKINYLNYNWALNEIE